MAKVVADLDVASYSLGELLALFHLDPHDHHMDEIKMKKAKRIVLLTHPDKSGLPSEYFLMYSHAYKRLYSLYEFNHKGGLKKTVSDQTYVASDNLISSEKHQKKTLDAFFDGHSHLKNSSDFNKWFNKEFEKVQLSSAEDGYEEWFRNDNAGYDENTPKKMDARNMEHMAELFDEEKRRICAVQVKHEVEDLSASSSFGSNILAGESKQEYSSTELWLGSSGLQFQDLHTAHTQSIIPVSNADYNPEYKNVNEMISGRANHAQNMKPLSEQYAQEFLDKKARLQGEQSTRRAFELAKEADSLQQKTNAFWGNIQRLH